MLLFFIAIKNETQKIFVTVGGLMDAKYGLINGKLHQTIGTINLNEIKNWNEIKITSQWVNINFQVQCNNRDAEHFSYNFITKNTRDMLNFSLKLTEDENKEIKFEDKKKKFPIVNFFVKFSACVNPSKKFKRLGKSALRTYLLSLKKFSVNS